MYVTFAYARDGHQADETVEVDDATGRLLIHDGVARAAAPTLTCAPTDPPESGDITKEAAE